MCFGGGGGGNNEADLYSLDLAYGTNLSGKNPNGGKGSIEKGQEWQSGESSLARAAQEKLQGSSQTFQSGENALNRALQERGVDLQEQQFGSQEEQRKLGQAAAQSGEAGFLQSTSQPNSALEQLAEQIRTGKNKDIQESENNLRANLYKSGVRGSRGASLIGQQTGQLTEKAMQDVNTLKSQDEIERQKAKQSYYSQKALSGYGRS